MYFPNLFSRSRPYAPLHSTLSDDETLDGAIAPHVPPKSSASNFSILVLLLALSLSILTNFVLGLLHWPTQALCSNSHASRYAGITRHVSAPFTLEGPFSVSQGRDVADRSWKELETDAGLVALTDGYVREKGLPKAMRFPWDEGRGVYFVNAYHNLHCLKKIYRALDEYDRGVPQSGAFPHVVHCLDTLRQDVMCNADDTPRYAVKKKETPTGGGQVRECRDWSQLEDWVQENTACWRYVNSTDPDMDPMERFKYCPAGSPYLEKARETYPDAGVVI